MYLFENGKVKELTNQDKVLFSRLLNAPIRKLLEKRADDLFLVQDFYPCGAKRTDPFLVKDKEDTFYSELTLSILNYKSISIVGELVVWHKNGQKLLACCIESFMFHGLYEEWSDLGIKLRERNFTQGKLHGVLKKWHENGQLSEEEHWENGQVHGVSKTYYREGQLASAQIMNNGVQHGVNRQWYKNGQIKCEEPYDNNKLNGDIKNWYETGQLKNQIAYKQGIKEGYCLEYYPNGQLKKKHYFKNNSETEIYEIYDKKGILIKSSHNDSMMILAPQIDFFEFPELVEHASRKLLEVINDQLYLVQDFYETGDKLTDPYYLLSKEEAYQTKVNLRRCFPSKATGLYKEYDRSGNLICQGSFLDGYRQGKWLVWQLQSDNNYYLQETSVYNRNILQRKITWHKNGCKQSEAIYNDKKEIILGRYNDDGSLCQSFLIKLLNANNGGCICRKIIENKKMVVLCKIFFILERKRLILIQ